MTFEDQLKALIFFHLEDHTAAQHLLQVLKQDGFPRPHIALEKGTIKSSFAEAINTSNISLGGGKSTPVLWLRPKRKTQGQN
jgi:hypothetical protein